ncbi:MAG: tyrosine-type recombinase/integrase [Lachnospiraceae bacterium]|nr:tyrosine-type recombinase/integrase [Lachnospiraceae bacterium]MDE7205479.1 tyrosine-type recombinase/integrase [Lachnospiraceae bacterium]
MPKRNLTYHEQKEADYTLQLRQLLSEMPPYAKDYFRAVEQKTSAKTRVSYAYDLQVFFHFLLEVNPTLFDKSMKEISLKDIDMLASNDIEEYQEYLKYYEAENGEQKNGASSIARKISSLRSFFDYFYKKEILTKNVAMQVDMPKQHEKAIIRLEPDEVAIMLDNIENYEKQLTGKKKDFFLKTKIRDIAIITLFLGTGIRVSECVGLDITDVNFRENSIRIIRKGGKESILYFGTEVEKALLDYIEGPRVMVAMQAVSGDENALFFSLQKKRISVHAVENLVEKYAKEFVPQKKITPHKLRSTFGTSLYQETGDIYLVADVLGHSDVGTTKKHYAAIEDQNRRRAASAIKLREKR